ncbi:hypothetical protein [Tuberibacillus sp. Marseille-P3662]|uniref:hypothetical protein n=1 Tax=Tuberibacillus sp. Marseille-P3662 TaxID=1965358 RepID=UPI000A1CE8E3|nr:hypothetical protein [Tuberibacillus sp. Marseille-P3662]
MQPNRFHHSKLKQKIQTFVSVLGLLISTLGGRFPRAWLEPPHASHCGVSRLMLFPQESPPAVPINDVNVLN